MASSTGLAVGLAVGIPCLLAVVIVFALWYRSSRRFKEEFENNKAPEDGLDDERDLDLDQIIQSQNDQYTPENTNSDLTDTKETEKGTLTSKTYLVRKQSKIMGLKLVPNQMNGPRQNHNVHSNSNVGHTSSSDTNSVISTPANVEERDSKGQRNYSNYYESVIPILPPQALGSNTPHGSNSPNAPLSPSPKIRRSNSSFSMLNEGLHHPEADFQKTANDKSQSSLQQEYIRQLHKQDSSSFPQTAYTLGNASPSAINLMNNYYPGSPVTSATNSSMNLLNGKRHGSSDLLSASARGSNQSLLMLGVSANKRHTSQSDKPLPPSPTQDELREGHSLEQQQHKQEYLDSKDAASLERPPSISQVNDSPASIPDKFETPFDTPPRASQYLSHYLATETTPEYTRNGAPVYSEESPDFNYNDLDDTNHDHDRDHDEVDMGVKINMDEDQQEYYSNYKSNKKEWLASLSGQNNM